MPKKHWGQCKLTGKEGQLVKCHILPQALTKPSRQGRPLMDSTLRNGPKRRWTSWYDPQIVSREGEDLLSQIDDAGIKAARRDQLVWQSWHVAPPKITPLSKHSYLRGFRRVVLNQDAEALRKFAHSILWRAAVSKLPAMRGVQLPDESIELLRKSTQSETPAPIDLFPVSLVQIVSKGTAHNLAPSNETVSLPATSESRAQELPITRIYLDGLIMHCHWDAASFTSLTDNEAFLGSSDATAITTIPLEASFQYENLLLSMFHSYRSCADDTLSVFSIEKNNPSNFQALVTATKQNFK